MGPDQEPASNPNFVQRHPVLIVACALMIVALLIALGTCDAGSSEEPSASPGYTDTGPSPSVAVAEPDHEHEAIPIPDAAPTCIKDGHTGGTKCSVCGFVLTRPTVIEKLGHTCIDGVCERCGETIQNGFAVKQTVSKPSSPQELLAGLEFDQALKEWPDLKDFTAYDLLNIYNEIETELSVSPSASDDAVLTSISRKYGITKDEALLAYGFVGMNYEVVRDAAGYTTADPVNLKPKYGKLSKAEAFGSTLDVTVSIDWIASNSSTVYQNYFNVCDMIQNQGADAYLTINYTATMPTTDGGTAAVVFFTVPKNAIDIIKAGDFPEITLPDYAEDLWIHPQLQD